MRVNDEYVPSTTQALRPRSYFIRLLRDLSYRSRKLVDELIVIRLRGWHRRPDLDDVVKRSVGTLRLRSLFIHVIILSTV